MLGGCVACCVCGFGDLVLWCLLIVLCICWPILLLCFCVLGFGCADFGTAFALWKVVFWWFGFGFVSVCGFVFGVVVLAVVVVLFNSVAVY